MQLVTVLCCVSVFFWLLAESRHAGENGLEEVFEQGKCVFTYEKILGIK